LPKRYLGQKFKVLNRNFAAEINIIFSFGIFQSGASAGEFKGVFFGLEGVAGGSEAFVENEFVPSRLQTDQRRENLQRPEIRSGLVLIQTGLI